MKNLIIFVVVVAGAYFAWNNLPGLRDKVTQAANKYGGWSEEARKNDPVGYIEYAIKALDKDVAQFTEANTKLKEAKASNEARLEEQRDKAAQANDLANAIKEQYKSAKENNAWPITVAGNEYTETAAVDLVGNLLQTKTTATALMADYEGVLATINKKTSELTQRISDSKFNKEKLMAQKELVKVDNLSTEADELLAKVNDLVEGNSKVAEGPAMTFDDLMKDIDKQAKANAEAAEAEASDSEARSWLDS